MKIPDNYHQLILNEFKEVEKICSEVKIPEDKLYLFSACYGIVNRIMNLHYHPTLVFMHQILQSTHQIMTQRLTAPRVPGSVLNNIPDEMVTALFSYFSQLITAFENKSEAEIREVLEKFSNLTYVATGNGSYLYLRGKLVL